MLCIYFVYCREIIEIGQEYGALYDILHSKTCFLKHCLNVGKYLLCLFCGGFTDNRSGCGIQRNLTAREDE